MLNFSRSKNTVNILIKNWLDMCIGAVVFWAFGFGLIYGPDKGHFIGSSYFFFHGMEGNSHSIKHSPEATVILVWKMTVCKRGILKHPSDVRLNAFLTPVSYTHLTLPTILLV